MDPPSIIVQTVTGRLPRTRGDGPVNVVCQYWSVGAPPHTRGWTLIKEAA